MCGKGIREDGSGTIIECCWVLEAVGSVAYCGLLRKVKFSFDG